MPFFRIVEPNGSLTFQSSVGKAVFTQPPADDLVLTSEPANALHAGVDALGAYLDEQPKVEGDPMLSPLGRAKKLTPLLESTYDTIARASTVIARHDEAINAREAAMLAVPKLDQSYAATAIEDRERRDWWRSLDAQSRMSTLNDMERDPAGNELMLIALLRSPIPQAGDEVKFARSIWERVKREANPSEAFAIEQGRKSSEWARRGLLSAVGLTKMLTPWNPDNVLRQLITSPNEFASAGIGVFGFTQLDRERMQQIISARAQVRA